MPETFAFEISNLETNQVRLIVEDSIEETQRDSAIYERWGDLEFSLKELIKIQDECSVENWEGMDELPVTKETIEKGKELLTRSAYLSNKIPLPSIAPTSSGLLELEWYKEKGHRFVIRLNSEGVFIYSGLFGTKKTKSGKEIEVDTHGTGILPEDPMPEDLMPEEIKSNLYKLYNLKLS